MSKTYVYNGRLKRARELRGWSQEELARRVSCLADSTGHQGVALDVSTISRWERGRNAPSPFYRQLLCTLFELNAEELGLLPASELSQPVENPLYLQEFGLPEIALDERTLPVDRIYGEDGQSPIRACDVSQNSNTSGPPPSSSRPYILFARRRDILIALFASITVGGGAAVLARWLQSRPKPTPPASAVSASPVASVKPAVSSGVSRHWPKVTPDIRKELARVRVIQRMLNAHGWHVEVDGVYWVETENAVMFFQEDSHIPVTSTISSPTWERLIISSKAAGQQVVDQGSQVKALQEMLNIYGATPRLQVDGEFGPLTEAATRRFQQTHHLAVTGKADLNTWCLLVGGYIK